MDSTSLRWVLAGIGLIFIAGIYVYTQYQNKMRRRSAIRTFTKEEMDVDFIEDELLRDELSHIHTMLDEGLNKTEISEIKINPGLDKVEDDVSTPDMSSEPDNQIHLPPPVYEIPEESLIAYVLKPVGEQFLTSDQLLNSFESTGFNLDEGSTPTYYCYSKNPEMGLTISNMTLTGSLSELGKEDFETYGLLCFFDMRHCQHPAVGYELMLKKIDELARELNLKVYDQNLQLLTIQHVTDMRDRMKTE